MRALVRGTQRTRLMEVPTPEVARPDEVKIRVELAGICRTDLYAAAGMRACRAPVVLGHEVAGIVEAVGAAVTRVRVGDRVAVSPFRGGATGADRWAMMGVDFDGGFADYTVLPESMLYACPETLDARRAAYVEPVAASMAPLRVPIRPEQRGLIYGVGRIAGLTEAVLRAAGFHNIFIGMDGEDGAYDFVIETRADRLDEALRLTRDGGLLVLKSRPAQPVRLNLLDAVQREVRMVGAHYGSFEEAIAWLDEGRLEVDHLLGPEHPLDAFISEDGARGLMHDLLEREDCKHFLAPEA